MDTEKNNIRNDFITAATWHGRLDEATALLNDNPWIATCDIHTSAILGNVAAVQQFLSAEPALALVKSPPYHADALVHACMSKYLRLEPWRSADFLQVAGALLDAGANPNSGFWSTGTHPEWETALYGAAGIAHHADLTRLLLAHGADPNDEEAVYHSPETYLRGAMEALVQTGRVTSENLSMMLIRKIDWHDTEGVAYLLNYVDPNVERQQGWNALHHALLRDNSLEVITLLLDKGANPAKEKNGVTAIARAARQGRSDVLSLLTQRGIPLHLSGVDQLIAACANGEATEVNRLISADPALKEKLIKKGGQLLSAFSGTGNAEGVARLLDCGIDVHAPFEKGDGYFGIPANSLAIHVAAWRGRPNIVKLLINRGSSVDVPDANGHTPLALAIKACVDSYWTERRTPESVEALLRAGASTSGIPFPSGYDAADQLLEKYRNAQG